MDELIIEGIITTPLKKIHHPKGDIFHGLKKNGLGFVDFGEAYFSIINNGEIKGWNKHKRMTINLIVPVGEVTFVIYDDREKSTSKDYFFKVTLSQANYQRLTIPPGLWFAFKGKKSKTNLILNIASIEHDPNEIDRLELDRIDYNWESI